VASFALRVNDDVLYEPYDGRQRDVMAWLIRRVCTRLALAGNLWLWGNRGGGKSRLVRAFLHTMALAFPGLKYVVVRRNYPDLQRNHLIYVGHEVRKLGGDYNVADHQANYPNGSIGFYCQCETDADVEKIVGAEAAILFVDEAPQIGWDRLRMLTPSLRVPKNADGTPAAYRTLSIYSGNPVGESIDAIWSYFIDKDVDVLADPEYRAEDFEAIELRLEDNPALDPLEYRRQFVGLPDYIRKAWLDGVRMESRTLFNVYPSKHGRPYHYIPELPRVDGVPLLRVPWTQVYCAFDMGFFPDPACCLWFVVLGRRTFVVHERTWFHTVAKDLALEILRETRELFPGRELRPLTYSDPKIDVKTGHDIVTTRDVMEMAGLPIECSVNDRVLYADAIHGLLGEEVSEGVPRLQIYQPGCPMLAKALPKMRWDETNPRKMGNHPLDHWPVSLAYYAISSGVLSVSEAATMTAEPIWMQWVREARTRRAGRR
jgi:hypothetical protein